MSASSNTIYNEKYCYDLNVLRNKVGPYSASYCSGGAFEGIELGVCSFAAVFLAILV
jgi:hypothetical protein